MDWSTGAVRVLTEAVDWPESDRPRRAGISAFGVSGTNAHLILEQPPATEHSSKVEDDDHATVPLVLSGKSSEALRDQAGRLLAKVEDDPSLRVADLAYSSVAHRALFEHRAALVSADRENLLADLRSLVSVDAASTVITGMARSGRGVVFVFPGQGGQWVGMGRELLAVSPVFAESMRACEGALSPFVEWSLIEVLTGEDTQRQLDRVDVVQPALWAIMVSLAAVLRSYGVEPDAVVGHSQGEIAAAYVAGALSLEDAARVIALRSQALKVIAGTGGMISVRLSAAEAQRRLDELGEPLSVAVVNGARSVAVGGEVSAVDRMQARWEAEGIHVRRINGDYASHTVQVERVEQRLMELLAPVVPQKPEIAWYSTVDCDWLDGAVADAGYWYRNLRETVQFDTAVRALLDAGNQHFVEVSPHPVVTMPIRSTMEELDSDAAVAGVLRRDHGGLDQIMRTLAELVVRGVTPDWSAVFSGTGARSVDLPTYAFQHQHYWLAQGGKTDLSAAGMDEVDHPFLGATLTDPESGVTSLTGRISLASQRWLADHAADGVVLLPGAALVEIALHAGAVTDTPELSEFVIEAGLRLPADAALRLQVTVRPEDDQGRRELSIHSRTDQGRRSWTRHARGLLAPHSPASMPNHGEVTAWPPRDAEPVDVTGFYDKLERAGYGYGPAFRGLRAAWRRDKSVLAEVVLPEAATPGDYGIHPALFDAALQSAFLAIEDGDEQTLSLPFAWNDVVLHATGATTVRVFTTVTSDGDGTHAIAVEIADPLGKPVLSLGTVVTRPISIRELTAPSGTDVPDMLFGIDWTRLDTGASTGRLAHIDNADQLPTVEANIDWLVLGPGENTDARIAVNRVLAVVQAFLGDHARHATRLVVTTRSAVAAPDTGEGRPAGHEVPDPVAAAVAGLIRSAQAEHPGRILLIDTDERAELPAVPAAMVAAGENEVVVRHTTAWVPRLVRVAPDLAQGRPVGENVHTVPRPLDPAGTVLITGATGTLGRLVARHLVTGHGIRSLVLASRRGDQAPGAAELGAELTELGAWVRFVRCDIARRADVQTLLAAVPSDAPLTAVVHAAAVLDDGVVEAMTPEQVDRVFAPKLDGAVHLDELTRHLDLAAFVVFSSGAGVLGNGGQANYSAANAFLDALMARRRADGRPGLSLAWGYWADTSDTSSRLDRTELAARMRRNGFLPLESADGLRLLDDSLRSDRALLIPVPLDIEVLRERARASALPAVLRGVVGRVRAVAAADRGQPQDALAGLAGLGAKERVSALTDLVRAHAAAAIGTTADAIRGTKPFRDLGFDSLTAIEMRNRLVKATGVSLPATLIFDYPSAAAVAEHLHELTGGSAPSEPETDDLETDDLAALEAAELIQLLRGELAVHSDDTNLDK
ncbi:SDR family NAD(P)-dependent oxidoreductase [Amycolatopsis sp. NPDC059657]|uniref:type I polyketide synthase n=1 Tax=Amycolatopsis sp. NPDC059657 TaxID=3346899 RepID=UPI00366F9270